MPVSLHAIGRTATPAPLVRAAAALLGRLVLGGLLLGGLLLGPAGTAQAAGPATVTALTLATGTVTVSGTAEGTVGVTAGLTFAPNTPGGPVSTADPVVARVSRVSVPGNALDTSAHFAVLHLASGTVTQGVWTGSFRLPSTANGTWRVDRVMGYSFGVGPIGPVFEVDPRTDGIPDRTLTVVGLHRPVMTLTQSPVFPLPRPAGGVAVTIGGRVVYSDTGAGVAGYAIAIGTDTACIETGGAPTTTTRADGSFGVTRVLTSSELYCVTSPLPSATVDTRLVNTYQRRFGLPVRAIRLSAAVTDPTLVLGRATTVTGSVFGLDAGGGTHVYLQRFAGGSWNTVASAPVRTSGRYTLPVNPPVRGRNSYRVWFPSQGSYRGTTTGTLTVTVT